MSPNVLDEFINAGQGYGQFYNRNHFALLMEMALGLLFGILLKAELSEKVRFIGWVIGGMMIYATHRLKLAGRLDQFGWHFGICGFCPFSYTKQCIGGSIQGNGIIRNSRPG